MLFGLPLFTVKSFEPLQVNRTDFNCAHRFSNIAIAPLDTFQRSLVTHSDDSIYIACLKGESSKQSKWKKIHIYNMYIMMNYVHIHIIYIINYNYIYFSLDGTAPARSASKRASTKNQSPK